MKQRKWTVPLIKTSFALAVGLSAVNAGAHDYTYVEGGLLQRHDRQQDDVGGRIAGSVSVLPQLALIGELSSADDFDQFSAGAVFHQPINPTIDWVVGGTVEHADNGRVDDTGLGARSGLRIRMDEDRLELLPEVRLTRLFGETDVSGRAGAAYEIAPKLDVIGAAQLGDEDRLEAGLRYRFAR